MEESIWARSRHTRAETGFFYKNTASQALIKVKNPVSLVSMRPGLIQHISTDALNLCNVNRGLSFKGARTFPTVVMSL